MKNYSEDPNRQYHIQTAKRGNREVRHYARRSEKMCEDRAIFR